ncbi:hypothetical protein ACLOJK_021661 [Asimina triloba]
MTIFPSVAMTIDQKIKQMQELVVGDANLRKRPMTAAAFSGDGSVLAVAAEDVVTLWDPDTNVLVAVIGETLMVPIRALSFIGKSEYLVTVSQGSKPHLAVWSLSKLDISWSYKLHTEALACTADGSQFAVLSPFRKSWKQTPSDEVVLEDEDGVILLFNVEDPVPVATWSIKKVVPVSEPSEFATSQSPKLYSQAEEPVNVLVAMANGGGLSFLQPNPSSLAMFTEGEVPSTMLVYINGNHEYVIFDPHSKEEQQMSMIRREQDANSEERGRFGFASIYGELPEFKLKKGHVPAAPFVPSDRPWETIFNGSSHVLPPLTTLCSAFLESLLQKKSSIQQ